MALLSLLLYISCIKPHRSNNEITKIELARSGAWSDNGAAIGIDSILNYRYYNRNVKHGYFAGKISEAFWDTLNQKFEKIKFKTLNSDTLMNVSDASYFELIIHWKNGTRRVVKIASGNSLIDSTFMWLNHSYSNIKLQPIKTPLKFETIFQRNIEYPSIDSVKFPPPKIKNY